MIHPKSLAMIRGKIMSYFGSGAFRFPITFTYYAQKNYLSRGFCKFFYIFFSNFVKFFTKPLKTFNNLYKNCAKLRLELFAKRCFCKKKPAKNTVFIEIGILSGYF